MIHKDSQGRIIEVGQRVAYNLSGDVVPGVVVELCWSHIKIKHEPVERRGGPRVPTTHVSRVRNTRGIYVIPNVLKVSAPRGSDGIRAWEI